MKSLKTFLAEFGKQDIQQGQEETAKLLFRRIRRSSGALHPPVELKKKGNVLSADFEFDKPMKINTMRSFARAEAFRMGINSMFIKWKQTSDTSLTLSMKVDAFKDQQKIKDWRKYI